MLCLRADDRPPQRDAHPGGGLPGSRRDAGIRAVRIGAVAPDDARHVRAVTEVVIGHRASVDEIDGADEPRATIVVPCHSRPSRAVFGASGPSGLTKRATQASPKVLGVPAGSSELSDPKNTRPWLSHAITGSPELAVLGRWVTAGYDVSSG